MRANIHFLGEEDFLPTMEKENKAFRKEHVTQGSIKSYDGTRLNYYVVEPANPIGSVTIVHGMGEFFGKYHEYVWYLYQAGFKVFFLENRGHGYSEGKVKDPSLIYINNYSTYVEDLKSFVNSTVYPQSGNLPMLLIAHSMGGAIATYFLEKYPGIFKAVILSSPMLKMKSGNLSPVMVMLIKLYCTIFRKYKAIAPNQKRFNPDTPFEGSSAKSKARFDYQLEKRRKDDHYQTTAATFGWALASIKVNKTIFRNIKKLNTPVHLFTAGQDHLIDPEGYELFKSKVTNVTLHHFDESRHEIFNSDEASRKKYFKEVIEALEAYAR